MALKNGARFPVSMHEVLPHGCCLVPDSIAEATDYDEKTKRRTPSVDKVTGTKVWHSRVSDLDPELAGRVAPARREAGRRESRSGTATAPPALCGTPQRTATVGR